MNSLHDTPAANLLGLSYNSKILLFSSLYCIANEPISCEEGVARLKRYINSTGRYGNTPFLLQLYGVSEIVQAFCRW